MIDVDDQGSCMDAQSLLWFGIAGGAGWFALTILWQRYVKRTRMAVQSRGSYTMFAILMLFFACAAAVAGIMSIA